MKCARLVNSLLLAVGVAFATPSEADSLAGIFNIHYGTPGNTIAGQISFTLNGDGTISASLFSNFGGILGFAYDSPSPRYTGSQFPSEGAGYTTTAWVSDYGFFGSGIYWENETQLPPSEISWIIGNPGEFTSVWQTLGGNAAYDFVLFQKGSIITQWAASATAAVPETDTWAMLLAGLGLVGAVAQRRKTQ